MRRIAVLTGFLVLAMLTTSAAANAQGSRILSVTRLSDPGLIDVSIAEVSYDSLSGAISVTGTVSCAAEGVDVYVIDYAAAQTRAGATTTGSTYTVSNPCGETFSAVIQPDAGGRFLPGRATVEVAASACSFSCTVEVVRAEVLLIPEPPTL